MNKLFFLTLLSLFFFSACSKTETNTVVNNGNNTTGLLYILTSNNWYPDSALSGTSNVLIPCHLDDRYIFKNNGLYEINYGATKCWASQPSNSTSSSQVFILDESNKTMLFHNFGEDIECTIVRLDNNRLILEGHKVDDENYYYYISYKAI